MASLSVGKLKALANPGRHGDGDGLYLNIAKSGSKSWILRAVIDGKRRDLGPVTPSPPSAVLTPSIPVHRWIRG